SNTIDEARKMLEESLYNQKAFNQFKTLIQAQGGDTTVIDDPEKLPSAAYQVDFTAKLSGNLQDINADYIGQAAMMLGAGRQTKESKIDLAVGVVLHKKVGDAVNEGDTLLTVHANEKNIEPVLSHLKKAITIS